MSASFVLIFVCLFGGKEVKHKPGHSKRQTIYKINSDISYSGNECFNFKHQLSFPRRFFYTTHTFCSFKFWALWINLHNKISQILPKWIKWRDYLQSELGPWEIILNTVKGLTVSVPQYTEGLRIERGLLPLTLCLHCSSILPSLTLTPKGNPYLQIPQEWPKSSG